MKKKLIQKNDTVLWKKAIFENLRRKCLIIENCNNNNIMRTLT